MVQFSGEHLTENLFLLITTIVSLAAWVIAFGALCAMRAVGASWWVMIFNLLLVVGIIVLILTNTFSQYRLVVLAFLAVSISYVTEQLSFAIALTAGNDNSYYGYGNLRAPAGAYAAGYIILIIIEILWVFVFGSEPNSYLGQFGHLGGLNSVQQQPHHGTTAGAGAAAGVGAAAGGNVVSHDAPIEMTQEKTAYDGAVSPQSPTMTHPSMATSPVLEYSERVEALHEYRANPEDPSELSFDRGDILEIVDRRGNWWQARKTDGTTGIIPSNYFA
ncbi:hypothetical protein BCR42DRAFT_428261 [Absidia repens]|uniref:SH3 domain-containing protein n=1 Tax=Absidia repens TaxID=90262 RepID=A0A1X2HYQ7_9FUNG|nr:hypothetical protein BCR42DRAFT_428261 [Absidia repens]